MNELTQIFNYEGKEVRTVIKNGEPWWIAKDICDILEIRTSDVRAILENDEVSTFNPNVDTIDIGMEQVLNPHTIGKNVTFVEAGRGGKDMLIVSEAGLYSLILKSRKPEAKAFKRWITHEVIPQIRKTGSYSIQPLSPAELLLKQAEMLVEQEKRLAKVEDKLTTAEHRLSNLDGTNIEGTPRQKLNKMIHLYAFKKGVTYSRAWEEFRQYYNTAFHTNLDRRMDTYCRDKFKVKCTIPEYLEDVGEIMDALRVADKMLNK